MKKDYLRLFNAFQKRRQVLVQNGQNWKHFLLKTASYFDAFQI